MPGKLIRFSELCERLVATGGKLEKRAHIAEYLSILHSGLPRGDASRAALYLAGMPFAETDARTLNVGGALLTRTLAELSQANQQAMHAAYLRHGNLGSAAYDLLSALPERRDTAPTLALVDVDSTFAAIAAAPKPAAKQRLIRALLLQATPLEAKYLIKIILGDMRTGVKESLVEEAVATAFGAGIAEVRRARMLNGSLAEVVELAAGRRLAEARMKLFHPLGFMLASPIDSAVEAFVRFSRTPPFLDEVQVEDKYDGIRAQIHCGDPEQPGRVVLFSRSREDVTASFPELVEAFARSPKPVILDGEILAWKPIENRGENEAGHALPFTSLQPRLGRKRVTAGMRETAPVVFMAFDLLYADGELMLDRTLKERRQTLEALVAREQSRTRVSSRPFSPSQGEQGLLDFETPGNAPGIDEPGQDTFARLVLAPAAVLKSVAQLEDAYREARERGNEGLMLKARDSVYQPGRRGLAWLKLKREMATLDVVVTAAEYGHGKRAGILSDYTFAIRDSGTLKNVGKAYTGLTDAEITKLTAFFLEHTIEDFGGMRTVEPVLVLEVAFNNIMRSDRHESGFALRFPRIVGIRDDKPVSEIDTLDRVANLYDSQDATRRGEGGGAP